MRDMHLSFQLLKQYASVNAILDQLVRDAQNERLNRCARRRQQRENDLLARVEGMVATLHMSKRVITQREISGSLGMSLERLYYYPRVRATLQQYPSCQLRARTQLHEEDLVERVHAAIAQLRSSGRCVCQEAISRLVGLSAYMLKKYPLVDSILDPFRQEYHLRRKKCPERWKSDHPQSKRGTRR
jgi:DNA-binding transcriptional LysR family regulator